jgi:uncharacterized protein (TIGR03067 family)
MTSIGGEAVSPNDPLLKIEFRPGNANVGEYLITRGTDEVEAGEFRLTDTPTGLQVDFGPLMGENAGKIQLGIMKVNGPNLTWCMSPAGSEERPMAFANLTPDAARSAGLVSDGSTVIEAVRADLLEGTWTILEQDGTRYDGYQAFMVFHGDRFYYFMDNKIWWNGHFRLNANQQPMQIDFVSELSAVSNQSHKIVRGLVELKGSALRICNGGPGNERPAIFISNPHPKPGDSLSTIILYEKSNRHFDLPGDQSPAPAKNSPNPKTTSWTFNLPGAWTVTSIGGRTRNSASRPMTFIFEGQDFRMEDDGMVMLTGTWQLNPRTTPAAIDITLVDKNRQPTGDLILGIVEVAGNTLRLAMGDPNTPRPNSFSSSKETDGVDSSLMIAERQ